MVKRVTLSRGKRFRVKTVGIYIWPNMTALDVLGPQQILGYVPEFDVVIVAKSKDPVVTDTKVRILPDHDRITGGGVTAGIDVAFALVSQIVGPDVAAGLQLLGEYDPQPATPFGNPNDAPAGLVAAVRAQVEELTPALAGFMATKGA